MKYKYHYITQKHRKTRGDSAWYYYYSDEAGRMHCKTTSRTRKADAIEYAKQQVKEMSSIVDKPKRITLLKFLDEYNSWAAGKYTNNTLRNIKSMQGKVLKYLGDSIILQKINKQSMDMFISSVEKNSGKYSAVNTYKHLKSMLSKAVDWRYMDSNPLKSMKKPDEGVKQPKFLTESMLNSLIEATDDTLFKNLYIVAFYTGLRQGELLNLKWDAVDMDTRELKVVFDEGFTPKGKEERVVPLCAKAVRALDSIDKISIYVFGHSRNLRFGRYLSGSFISKRFRVSRDRAQLDKKLNFHSLRHSFASYLVQHSVGLMAVGTLMGHKNLRTTEKYSHLNKKSLNEAIDAFN